MYTRASASDYDDWEKKFKNPGWGSEDIIPLIKKVCIVSIIYLHPCSAAASAFESSLIPPSFAFAVAVAKFSRPPATLACPTTHARSEYPRVPIFIGTRHPCPESRSTVDRDRCSRLICYDPMVLQLTFCIVHDGEVRLIPRLHRW